MLDLQDIHHEPSRDEISEYVGNPLLDEFFRHMEDMYKALCKIEYSKDSWARGWNIKFRKAGKSLCVVYPKVRYFTVLVVVSRKEKERVEQLLPHCTERMQAIYHATREGNGQRWLMVDLYENAGVYQDTLQLIRIRRECR